MELTITNSLIILLGIVITWLVLFSLLTEKNTNMVGIKLGILVLLFSPFIASASYYLYATWSRQWFMMSGGNGEIQLAASPLKVPKTQNNHYCDQFTDSKGNLLNSNTISRDLYCGEFWNMGDVVFLPFKILGNNKAIYWASPELKIIGPAPEIYSKSISWE